ncbi:hypothetical protein BGZ75_001612, partial [Mortierella antarctica]
LRQFHSPSTNAMRPLAPETTNNVKQQLNQGRSARDVANNVKVSVGFALKVRNSIKENVPPPKLGRPSKISKDTRKVLARQFNNGITQSLQDGQRMVQSADGGQVHARTVRRHLQKEAHMHWNVEQWKTVTFSDESTISRVGSFGKKFYYSTKEHKSLKPHQVKETKQ